MKSHKHAESKPLEIQVEKQVLLSGQVLKFNPAFAKVLGGDLHTIVYHQVLYLSRDMTVGEVWAKAKRLSLTRLQRHIPFVSRRWLIQVLHDLENEGFIFVERSGRVNVYIPCLGSEELDKSAAVHSPPAISSNYIVIPLLAKAIGLKSAIVLQQIHIRNHQGDGSNYFIRSLDRWHSETFPFWGIATIKRIFSNLQKLNLIVTKPYRREDDGFINSYRINYAGVANLLDLPIPVVENPFDPHPKDKFDKSWLEWTNPVTLKKQSEI